MKAILLASLMLFPSLVSAKGIIFIVHPDCPVKTLTPSQIRDYYFKKNRQWPNHTAVRFFERNESSPLHDIFVKEILQRSPRQVDRYWIEQKFKTGDSAPSAVDSDLILLDLVSRFPGSISYISDDVPLTKPVKVVPVSGD